MCVGGGAVADLRVSSPHQPPPPPKKKTKKKTRKVAQTTIAKGPQWGNRLGTTEDLFFFGCHFLKLPNFFWGVYQNGNFTPLKGPHRKLLTWPFSLNPPVCVCGGVGVCVGVCVCGG